MLKAQPLLILSVPRLRSLVRVSFRLPLPLPIVLVTYCLEAFEASNALSASRSFFPSLIALAPTSPKTNSTAFLAASS